MKLAIVGLGQCGCNIADSFYSMNSYSESFFNRRIEVLTDTFAINTDEADLGGFKHIPKDKNHRILIGTMSTFGHGVGKINTEAANIVKSANAVVVDAILRSSKFHESDAILVIASGGGGTGSGTIGWVCKTLKEKTDKPVYAMVVLPFAFEEKGNISYAVINTATCTNTVTRYADATFLFDNEHHRKMGSSLRDNIHEINEELALNFYDLCCAGEEKKTKYVGSKVIDAGDIKQSLEGLSVIGRGEVKLPMFRWQKGTYRQEIKDNSQVFTALRQAETNIGLGVDLQHARKILLLITSPKDYLTTNVMEEIFSYLQRKAPNAVIRIGDYPRRDREVSVTLIASQLIKISRLERLYLQADNILKKQEQISLQTDAEIELMREINRKIPTLD
jgi:cell division GTPase FtsZ